MTTTRALGPLLAAVVCATAASSTATAAERAAIVASTTGKTNAGTVATSSSELIAASTNATGRVYVQVVNQSAVTIACRYGGTAAVGGAGSFDILAGWTRSWTGPFVPSDALNCISASGSASVTWTAY